MKVEFIGKDPDSDIDQCPTVWTDTDSQELLIQGYIVEGARKAACEATSPTTVPVPDSEMIIRVPARLVPALREACDAVEHSALR